MTIKKLIEIRTEITYSEDLELETKFELLTAIEKLLNEKVDDGNGYGL